jgi:hypothetical protein
MPTDEELQTTIDSMWGYVGEGRRGWKSCQYIREGRVLLTQVEEENLCQNRPMPGEKYCEEHMPIVPSRIVWFTIGAVAMRFLMYFIR